MLNLGLSGLCAASGSVTQPFRNLHQISTLRLMNPVWILVDSDRMLNVLGGLSISNRICSFEVGGSGSPHPRNPPLS
ncbi:hypothetical protein BD309DRAFT_81353 [Dichomitus squalens]|nr:hypothetical protein BD309DRAFT_81353 [Dichomitus squalens]